MAVARQSPASSLPPFSQKQVNTTTWGTTGNTSSVVTDAYVVSNSFIVWYVTGTTPQVGRWSITIPAAGGSFTLTSSDSESATLPFNYIVL